MKLKVTHDPLVYVVYVNVMGGSERTVRKNSGVLIVDNTEIGLQVHADKTNHVVMSVDKNGGQNNKIKKDNKPAEKAEEFKYLGTS